MALIRLTPLRLQERTTWLATTSCGGSGRIGGSPSLAYFVQILKHALISSVDRHYIIAAKIKPRNSRQNHSSLAANFICLAYFLSAKVSLLPISLGEESWKIMVRTKQESVLWAACFPSLWSPIYYIPYLYNLPTCHRVSPSFSNLYKDPKIILSCF